MALAAAIGLTLTVLAYLGAVWLYRRSGNSPYLIPVLPAVIVVVAVLLLTGTPYPLYFAHVEALYFLIGPATVALAVPLFGQLGRIRQMWRPLGVALVVGSSAAIVSAVLIAWALGGSLETILSLAPKSASMPFALPVAERLGGLASLAAVDLVVMFAEDTPDNLIRQIRPDILIKGADYKRENIVGADFVTSYGGEVMLAELVPDRSTSDLIGRARK